MTHLRLPLGTRVRVRNNVRAGFARGRMATVSTCPQAEDWLGTQADNYPIVVDLDPWAPGDAPDRDFHFSLDELEVVT